MSWQTELTSTMVRGSSFGIKSCGSMQSLGKAGSCLERWTFFDGLFISAYWLTFQAQGVQRLASVSSARPCCQLTHEASGPAKQSHDFICLSDVKSRTDIDRPESSQCTLLDFLFAYTDRRQWGEACAEASAARENADHACKQCLPLVNLNLGPSLEKS